MAATLIDTDILVYVDPFAGDFRVQEWGACA